MLDELFKLVLQEAKENRHNKEIKKFVFHILIYHIFLTNKIKKHFKLNLFLSNRQHDIINTAGRNYD